MRPAFTSQIGTAGCSSCKQDYAMETASSVRTQSLRQCLLKKDSVCSGLHLEVSPKVSDLGVSQREIGGPHTRRVLQGKELKNKI